jgi:hypothetical protein
MYLVIEENPNCVADERVFSESGKTKPVAQLNVEQPSGIRAWCDVMGVEEGGVFAPAQAVQVEDSGAGNAWLIFGGSWGLRFRPSGSTAEWSVTNSSQWGVPFKVLDFSGEDIK